MRKCPKELLSRIKKPENREIKTKSIVVIFGMLGNFDSFEYAQLLSKSIAKIEESDTNLFAFGIGNDSTKKRFCKFTGLPHESLLVCEDNQLHKSLGLNSGLSLPFPVLINLILMCAGIGSPGTLREVLRGYLGDKHANQRLPDEMSLQIGDLIKIDSSTFKFLLGEGYQRPFELATLRLINMAEILMNWQIYISCNRFLTQLGATYLLDSNSNIVYEFLPQGILGYSETMENPLAFLDGWI